MLDLGMKSFEKFSLPEKIIGDKLILVKRTREYDAELFAMINRSRDFLRRYLFWIDDTKTPEDVAEVTAIFANNWQAQNSYEYLMLEKTTRKLVGAGGIHTISYMNRWAEYGYYLDKDAVGNGYVTEFVTLLEKELFAHGIHRLVIECDAENTASANVAKRCGFSLDGCLKGAKFAYNTYHDELVFSKINPAQ